MKRWWRQLCLGLVCMGFLVVAQGFNISQKQVMRIGVKIWYNESNGKIAGLTDWAPGEHFASLGIGHFIWYPHQHNDVFDQSFPKLVQYLKAHGAIVPKWLDAHKVPPCLWPNRAAFLHAQNSKHMDELRLFLYYTIPLQAKYMTYRLEQALPKILAYVPIWQRRNILRRFYAIARTSQGVYALVDYVNFKGEGAFGVDSYNGRGWGLLQVLKEMQYAPFAMTPLQQFVWAADQVLTIRVDNAPPERHEERWLNGWRNRIHTYLE